MIIVTIESIRYFIAFVYWADCCIVCIITHLYYLFDDIVVNHHTPSIEQCLHETSMQINEMRLRYCWVDSVIAGLWSVCT